MTDAEQREIIRRYVDHEITAEEAADDIGPGTAVVDVILAARRMFGRLPDQRDAFTEGEHRRALKLLGLDAKEAQTMHDTEWNKQFVARHFDDLVNRKDLTAVERNFAPDFVDHDGPDGAKANVAEGLRRFVAGLERFPDLRVDIRDLVAEGDRVAVRAVWSGTEAASGQRMEMHGFVLWRIAERKLAERWAKTTSMSPLTSETLVW